MGKVRRRLGILTGGGDVPSLNAVIASANRACRRRAIDLTGFVRGWEGVVEKEYVELNGLAVDPAVGGTILKSSRMNLDRKPGTKETALRHLRDLHLEGLIVVGGEDTLSNSLLLPDFPQVFIAKTIDNDVGLIPAGGALVRRAAIINYFSLGFPTAARRIASFVSLREGLRSTAYSHERIVIVESMGMHAGRLALSSCAGRPDFIIIPEFPVDYERFTTMAIERYRTRRHLIIVVAEGARFSDGSYMSADDGERDEFGHPRFRGAAEVLARMLRRDLRGVLDTRNVNAVNPSYLYRSGLACGLDMTWAAKLGRAAVGLLSHAPKGPVFLTIRRGKRGFRVLPYPLSGMGHVDDLHRFVDPRFYDPRLYDATRQGRAYLRPIIGEAPMEAYGLPWAQVGRETRDTPPATGRKRAPGATAT